MGDGAIVEFGSVVDAVACGLAIQPGVRANQRDKLPDRRIAYRIGVNLGDVVVDGDDLMGDGVNIAARREQICPPGACSLPPLPTISCRARSTLPSMTPANSR
jgi:class 3 adenylate cyclase